jgi:peptidoglycan hydrolase CwlO-like protein
MKNIVESLKNIKGLVIAIAMLLSASFGFGTSYALIQARISNMQLDIQKVQTEVAEVKIEVQRIQIESARRDECINSVKSGIDEIKIDLKKLVFDRRF